MFFLTLLNSQFSSVTYLHQICHPHSNFCHPHKCVWSRRLKHYCRMLQIFDHNNRICFIIDIGSAISIISANKLDKSCTPDNKVLYSATENEIKTYGDKVLDIDLGGPAKYSRTFTKTDLNFSVIGVDFLMAYKLTVNPFNRCLIDKANDIRIPLQPASAILPRLSCILPELANFSKFWQNIIWDSIYQNILISK